MRDETFFHISIDLLKNIFKRLLTNKGCVYIFGSSVRDDYNRYSDIDIAVGNTNSRMIRLLKYEIENLNIPYKVEVIDLNNVSMKIKKTILNEGIKIWGG